MNDVPANVFRGTQTHAADRTRLGSTSWTPCLGAAIVWSALPGDPWSSRRSKATFIEGSTVSSAKILSKNVLDLPGPSCSFQDVLGALQYEKDNGITHDEAVKVLLYLARRSVGKIRQPPFNYAVFDEDLEERLSDSNVPMLSILHARSWMVEMYEDFQDDPSVARRVLADTYAFADAPVVRTAALRLGFDAIRYPDVFAGGPRALEELMGIEPEEVDCLSEEWDDVAETEGGDWVWTHETIRPLVDDIIRIEWSESGQKVAEDYVRIIKENDK